MTLRVSSNVAMYQDKQAAPDVIIWHGPPRTVFSPEQAHLLLDSFIEKHKLQAYIEGPILLKDTAGKPIFEIRCTYRVCRIISGCFAVLAWTAVGKMSRPE